MKNNPILTLLCCLFLGTATTMFGQITGDKPLFYLSRYNILPNVGKSPVVLGDTIGIMGFRGWMSGNVFQRTAGMYAVVTSAPTANTLATRLTFATGASGMQDRMTILENGFVGINTNAPGYHLHVVGDAFISGDFTVGGNFKVLGDIEAGRDVKAGRDVLAGRNVNAGETVSGKNMTATENISAGQNITASQNITATGNLIGANLNVSTNATIGGDVGVSQNLNVGNRVTIGLQNTTTIPNGYRLYVAEGILTERVKVAIQNSSNWADYVFQPDYQLRPLSEVAQFIEQNGHLPGVPSAQEVAQQGIDVAAMDAKLLEKIEELTLYLLQMKKENEDLRKELETVKKSIH
jgi:hypothetical protein